MPWIIHYQIEDEDKALLDGLAAARSLTVQALLGQLTRGVIVKLRRDMMLSAVEAELAQLPVPQVTIGEVE